MLERIRRVYFFGYGADCEPDLIHAITGRKPRVIGVALLESYELRIQKLNEVTRAGANPYNILHEAWVGQFKSYVIIPKEGASVRGTLYRISLHDRHLVDKWELVEEGWYDKEFVTVRLLRSQKIYHAETQVLAPGQQVRTVTDGHQYNSWLIPKRQLLARAASLRSL
jgi:hypothetical protein